MERQSYSALDRILDQHGRIFSDSSIYRSSRGWYARYVYDAELSQLDVRRLAEVNDSLEKEIDWWNQPQTFSVGKVIDEMDRFHQILRGKLGYFRRKLNRNRGFKQRTPVAMEHPFFEICDNYGTILHKAFASLYKPREQDVFAVLENLVMGVGAGTSAKRDFSSKYGTNRGKNRIDLHTDEQVVAAALYSSVVENTPCAIVTPDSDHQRLLAEVQKYLNQREDLGQISAALRGNPIRVYFVKDEDTVLCTADTLLPGTFTG